ncbi:hypothetical protein HanRHA438_Chr11g0523811 [Helianthus annuus]|uniref:U-box domain-containing protein n=1 Tax=Helianthus annuus TaxID=4232 RepID=A0A9K3HS39_HELAN|nr:hypothetical protein HanXRQr2_Chr11g0511581 [Helianthus annuus]KAJ0503040.1 hypothetical protein HanHA300_Chr11g0419731 [Helianthus annuus]KAJ0511270.1 hypothetical protein HanIR_Chr11g0550061 [Helianthus annuus]KAJ0519002.1 hypothetical protein HanHA89_Chr11g0443741 [Helianthus annuus]KAJ0687002.1 hypothetical protein HanLR1_Chr11g0421031 [Helianthus annuus]
MKSLTRLKSIVLESEKNKRLMESVGAADYLSTIISNVNSGITSSSRDEALYILYHIKLSPSGLKTLGKTCGFVDALTRVMQSASSHEARMYSVMLLKSMFEVADVGF